jgi:hypothetical protein
MAYPALNLKAGKELSLMLSLGVRSSGDCSLPPQFGKWQESYWFVPRSKFCAREQNFIPRKMK